MKFIKTYKAGIKDLPFLLLLIDLIWWGFSLFNIYSSDYWIFGEVFAHSLSFVLFMSFYAYVHRYCLYSWVCIIALGILNLCNIFHYFIIFDYYHVYSGLIIFTGLIFAAIKWKQTYSKKF